MAKTWYLTARMRTYPGTNENLFAGYPTCSRDDFYSFQATGKLLFDNGVEKCLPSEPQTVTGTWSVSANDTKISISHPYLGGAAGLAARGGTIQELTTQKLVIVQTDTVGTTLVLTTSTYQGK
ncbi:lipocalin family protein [Hymenobacter algoricola]|uniref:Lipocalin-like domain-containing protein n=1 Tax=Hymenobacter algoricola TaxID=486267 RepID=A0ABP7NDG0_9BACT